MRNVRPASCLCLFSLDNNSQGSLKCDYGNVSFDRVTTCDTHHTGRKVIPLGNPQPALVAPPPPTSFSDIFSYISNLKSQTERRLLDGLVQYATDDQVFRAFRSKARLYIASDGGLTHTSATYGWIKKIKYKLIIGLSPYSSREARNVYPTQRLPARCI